MICLKKLEIINSLIKFIVLVSCLSLLYSCVPNKRLVYLQNGNDLEESQPKDSVLRAYDSKVETYRLKPEDIISLRVASVTSPEFNFINNYELQLGSIRELSQYSQGQASSIAGAGQQQFRNNNMGGMAGGGESGLSIGLTMLLESLDGGFKIESDGTLELPQIGKVHLSGLTITEAEKLVKDSLAGYYETPMVRIQLLNFAYTIMGEVESEGRYISFDPEINIFDAIVLAGNLTEVADRSNIKIVRKDGESSKVLYVNTLDEELLGQESFFIQPYDLIIVPPLDARMAQQYALPRTVTVLGILSSTISLILLAITLSN